MAKDESCEVPVDFAGDGGEQQGRPGQDAEQDAGPPEQDSQRPDALEGELGRERAKSAMLEDKLQHTLADYQNLEKSAQKEIEERVRYKLGQIMADIAGVCEDFVRARDAFAQGGADTAGLDSVIRNAESMLSRHGVEPIGGMGQAFDPGRHEAAASAVDEALEEGTIMQVIRKGYILNGRVIKPALVKVSKKGDEKDG